MTTETQQLRPSTPELRDYFRIISLRKWTAFFVFALVVAGVLYLSYRQSPVYESKLQLVVPEPPISVGTVQTNSHSLNLETEASIAGSPAVAKKVIDLMTADAATDPELSWIQGKTGEEIARVVNIAPQKGTTILLFRAQSGIPQHAADLANYFAQAYLDQRLATTLQPFSDKLTLVAQEIDDDNATLDRIGRTPQATESSAVAQTRASTQADLASQLNAQSEIKQAVRNIQSEARSAIISPAAVPRKPVRPNHLRDGILGAIVGLVLGLGAAFLRDYVDDSLRGVEDVERQSGATLIGVIPHVVAAKQDARKHGDRRAEYLVAEEDTRAPATEAYRTLRTNLMFMSATGPLRRVLISSPLQGEGKSTTAANLAAVVAQAGQRVLLVGADLRRPSIHHFFGVSNRTGLSSLLSGQAELAEAVQDPGVKGMRVLPGGPVPPNPAELLGSPAMRQFLEDAGEVTDWIILDGPPVLGLADTLVLSSMVDGVLMVVNEATNRRILSHARDQLGKVRARTVGSVLNNFGPAFSYYYSDYYVYSSQYYLAQEEQIARRDREDEAGARKLSRRDRRRAAKAAKAAAATATAAAAGLPAGVSENGERVGAGTPEETDEFFLKN